MPVLTPRSPTTTFVHANDGRCKTVIAVYFGAKPPPSWPGRSEDWRLRDSFSGKLERPAPLSAPRLSCPDCGQRMRGHVAASLEAVQGGTPVPFWPGDSRWRERAGV